MKLISPYKNIIQHTRVLIKAYQMNSDILNNLKKNLKNKVEKKCNKNGFIDEVYNIVEYSDGIMLPENLNGSAIYNITYLCRICIPSNIIIGNIKILNQELIIAQHGPILIFIPKDYINTTIWNIIENYENRITKKKLLVGEYIKIQIINKRINENDSQIKTIGELVDVTTNEEVNEFYLNKIDSNYI